MSQDLNIKVHHLTRVEGHGNIVVNMKDGVLEKAHLSIVEPPRFFEAMMKGRSFHEAAIITSRICGICSLGHQITSLVATEDALGLEISEQTELLRKLLVNGATLQSNVLHAYFLAAPDFLKVGSVFPLIATHKDVVLRALRMKRLANDIGDIVSGRAVHPITPVPGGFTRIPEKSELVELKRRLLEEALPDGIATIETMKSLAGAIPQFERETEYISLKHPDEYALYQGDIFSSDSGAQDVHNYLDVTNEFIVDHSTSKHARFNRSSYFVGALARWNNNHTQLVPEALEAAEAMGLKPNCYNPYMNTIAQVVEAVHVIFDSVRIIDTLLEKGLKNEKPNQTPTRYGRGIGSNEVPRGILFHDYTYDKKGSIVEANCIIPTGQNLANIDDDMKKLVPEIIAKSKEEITADLEMLVRAYDPCISCSVHMLDVDFIE
ncbi:MAG: Ni/Fe hydrogenase subunit alpha [Candidatus Marinimicrobia bacterium]|nr:Ni/Fe hydrogenase subunit alpha [Candidatus Neomarinimicrobiota bacterium]MCF7850569.1 Ni/Fe hydrogenase subunit alpha [Candidatus Neomarinimicrobiota bacterium]MCF7903697.1 Ni/Fe hydrogenase subunit alpha [Candidatus Neomarinimicrobiota bacterium]